MPVGELSLVKVPTRDGVLVQLHGVLDQSMAGMALNLGTDTLAVFDLDGISRVTSYGVLHWRQALRALKVPRYAFIRCRPSVVRQLNMVAGFGGSGEIHSVYAPYFCERCDREFQSLLNFYDHPEVLRTRRPPPMTCAGCGHPAELDEAPDAYLAFLKDYPPPKSDHRFRAVVFYAEMELRERRLTKTLTNLEAVGKSPPPWDNGSG